MTAPTDTLVFISDLHLSAERPDLLKLFETFLEKMPTLGQTLYILGDLFEYYLGDDDLNPFTKKIAALLNALKQKGIDIYFIPGNRDFLLGQKFCQQADIQLLSDPLYLKHGGQTALLSHGDRFCLEDTAYLQYRRIIQHPLTRYCIHCIPLCLRRALAKHLRKKSKASAARKKIINADLPHIWKTLQDNNAHICIHGHTHLAKTTPHPKNNKMLCIILNAWETKGHYLYWEKNKIPQHFFFHS